MFCASNSREGSDHLHWLSITLEALASSTAKPLSLLWMQAPTASLTFRPLH